MLSRLKIGAKISVIGTLALVGFVCIGGLYSSSQSRTDASHRQEELAVEEERGMKELQIDLLGLRRQEKDFFLRMDPKYIDSHAKLAQKATQDTQELQSLSKDKAAKELLTAVQAGIEQYTAQFAKVVGDYKEVGLTKDDGLQGQLRASVHAVETILKTYDDKPLGNSLLSMRRHEKDFLLREEDKYIESLAKEAANFTTLLPSSLLSPDDQSKAAKGIAVYVADFKKLAETTLRRKEDTSKLSAIYKEIEPKLEEYIALVQKNYQDINVQADKDQTQAARFMYASMAVIALLTFVLSWVIGRAIAKPITGMTGVMKELAAGNLSTQVPMTGRGDEIGEMAATVQIFKNNALEAQRLKEEQAEMEVSAAAEKRAAMDEIANSFERQVMGVITAVTAFATKLQASAEGLSAISEETSRRVVAVSGATEEASVNVQTVAAATEELVSSVAEINRQICSTTAKTQEASSEAARTNQLVGQLQDTAQEIGTVVTLIENIASQTNLLALNATIEAARAGDAGKGFAVVANEVKRLAEQTAKATEDIRAKIANIQEMADTSAKAVEGIATIVNQASEGASIIASAAEEQGAATAEISKSINEAASGTREVAENIVRVSEDSAETGRMSREVLEASGELSKQAQRLRQEVEFFIAGIRG